MNSETEGKGLKKKNLAANTNIGLKPRVMTKIALQREAQQADLARQEFLAMREAVKATEVVIPYVFYDGTDIPGGRCRVKKGDHIWLFLDRARKVGAERGVGGDKSRRDWARVNVDDLMLVRGEVILPPVRQRCLYETISPEADLSTALRFLPFLVQQSCGIQWTHLRLFGATDQGDTSSRSRTRPFYIQPVREARAEQGQGPCFPRRGTRGLQR